MVYRIFVEKVGIHAVEARSLLDSLKTELNIEGLSEVRIINRYDVEGISSEVFEASLNTVFSEPMVDEVYRELPDTEGAVVMAVEYLPGQYDQRADSCAQCIQIISRSARPDVRSARIYVFFGDISAEEERAIEKYIINPVESRRASLDLPETLKEDIILPEDVDTVEGFLELDEEGLAETLEKYSLAMDLDDLMFFHSYFFQREKRDPTVTELRLVDSYWSDHCRHTTFLTNIDEVYINDDYIFDTFLDYLKKRDVIYGARKKPVNLMDMATIAMKYLKRTGRISDLDESEEINACSVKVKVETESGNEDWLLMFKNETHNHPTEIEPFGGAATCLGGAIRDPLSGRSYVYQAMRVTGAGDVTAPISETIPGKLPQSKITRTAAAGYSSYGNQIGLATGGVYEYYHPGYTAKRMEIGAVIGAAPASNVVRERPVPGDVVILLGGRTGRDGCGGATGSSKAHTESSLSTCGAQVQKGNPPEERKIQRLFRDPEVTRLIKRCNDFGAGGVSVAIGELADGLYIDLNKIPKKYLGLDGTELAISESQERMAVVVSSLNSEKFIRLAEAENLEAVTVAIVTADNRLKMMWNGKIIVDVERNFLNSNGAEKHANIAIDHVEVKGLNDGYSDRVNKETLREDILSFLSDKNICSQKGLAERFDSTIGASTVLMPFGGVYQLTPSQVMAAKLPGLNKEVYTASLMSHGFDPYISEKSPYHGAMYAVVESVAKLVASGASYKSAYLTFQEYFERLRDDPLRWGKPAAALLGAYKAQTELEIGAIGGKDSMSGSFEDIDVPPTLVSFAVSHLNASSVISSELKNTNSRLYLFEPKYLENGEPDFADLRKMFDHVHSLAKNNHILSAWAVGRGGIFEGVCKMAFGNKVGVDLYVTDIKRLFTTRYGAIIVETRNDIKSAELLGFTNPIPEIKVGGEAISLNTLINTWEAPLEGVFPIHSKEQTERKNESVPSFSYTHRQPFYPLIKTAKPKVLIPVFPGTNCEYDSARAFERAGGDADIFVFKNLTPADLEDSIKELSRRIDESQILMIPGGFSGGDEPDGSGKFITAVLRNGRVAESVMRFLKQRDGLILGICNGFQALIKLGLLPYGEIRDMKREDATLTFNSIGRHQSMLVRTRVASVRSPWMALNEVGDVRTVAISHGEGRFNAPESLLDELAANGQIATQYVDTEGAPSMNIRFNPNGSDLAIEGITSPDGRVFGRMGHSERYGENVFKNVPGEKDMKLFEAGVKYFSI